MEEVKKELSMVDIHYEPKIYAPEAIVYRRGEKVNEIYIIESGMAQIYTTSKTKEIPLMDLSEGAIIGLESFSSDEIYSHSVKAKTKLIVKSFAVDDFKRYLTSFPVEQRKMILDKTYQVEHLLGKLDKSLRYLDDTANNIPLLPLSLQMIEIVKTFTDFFIFTVGEDRKIFVLDTLIKKLSLLLNVSSEAITKVLNVFSATGIITIKESPTNRYISQDIFERVYLFKDFVNNYNMGKYPLLIQHRISNQEALLLLSIVKYSKKLNLALDQTIKIKVMDLQESLNAITGTIFEMNLINSASKTGLINLVSLDSITYLELCPLKINRTIHFLSAMNKLGCLYEETTEESDLSLSKINTQFSNKQAPTLHYKI